MKSLILGARSLGGLLALVTAAILSAGCETTPPNPPTYSFGEVPPGGATNAPQTDTGNKNPTAQSQSADLLHPGNKLTIELDACDF